MVHKKNSKMAKFIISIAFIFVIVFLMLPLITIFYEALSQGITLYQQAITDEYAISAIKLSLLVVITILPLNIIFGLISAWCLARYEFRGKTILMTLIDIPFSVSPVIAGFIYLVLFSRTNFIGQWLANKDINILFAYPSIVIATIFITFPFITRELIPLLEDQGNDQEEAALVLGANFFKTIWYITLPNLKWGILYGIILSSARALGEFGAVAVVSGRITGETNTLPLYIEVLYNEYNFTGAFAVSSLLAFIGMMMIIFKHIVESKISIK